MKSRTVFLSFLVIVFLFGVITFAPIPNNPFSFKRFWQQTGMEKEEDLRRQLIAQRKRKAARILSEQMEALELDRGTLMENRKDLMDHSQGSAQQTVDSLRLREIERQKADEIKQQTEDLLKNEQDAQDQSQSQRDFQAQRIQEQRDRMNDLRDSESSR